MGKDIRTYSRNAALVATRRQQIVESGLKLFVKKGYGGTGIREIADACGMSMGQLYRYIGSKEDILRLIHDYDLSRHRDFFDKVDDYLKTMGPTEALKRSIAEYYRHVDEMHHLVLVAYQEIKHLPPRAREPFFERARSIVAAFENLLTKGCERGEFDIDNILVVAHNIVVIGETWALRRWFLRQHFTLEQYIQEQTGLVLKQICAEKAGVA